MTKDDKNKKLVTDQDIEDMLDNATSFSGEPMTEHDRKVIREYLQKLYHKK
ncbi:hypothetical protein [Lactobacillus gasseri]|jgi:hypothetical protein|uniref:Uncharacterized protein n=1 Tax=Lactobacillus gasseri TaxID=1596 RepID=A0ABY3BG10_LACGS|nr:hypothetical protein [Lactobacillus gasseri]KXA28021.1 hypothetical protein HMPREF3210_00269 [Lactobacillus gasseri]MDK6500059.1 hypothetical protein [Lactobacillus gasseri]TQW15011.1 hypothetical protein FIPPAONL_01222 [Lactobacillus gasseri]